MKELIQVHLLYIKIFKIYKNSHTTEKTLKSDFKPGKKTYYKKTKNYQKKLKQFLKKK